MSDIAIRVEKLSKLYRLGQKQERYKTLRDSVTDLVAAPFRKVGGLFRGESVTPAAEELWALRDVSFDVKRGEVIGVIGRNGAGKSTLLKVLSRITEPTSGHVDIHGRVGSLLEVGSGFHPELTGRENIFLNGAILGMRRAEIERKFDEIVAFAEVERFIDTPVKRYSSGMYLRLAFGVAAHLEPEILVVDEVLAVGDLSFQNKCLNKMQDVSGAGRTVLFVSHNMSAIHRLCSRCILMNEGQILADGDTDTVIQTYISRGLQERPEHLQPHNPAKPINLRRACIVGPDGEPSSEFRYDQGVSVSVDYEVNQPIAECSIWLGIRTAEEVAVFDTADTDSDAELRMRRAPGFYRTTVVIPPKWLNTGRYYLVLGIANLAYKIRYDRVEFAPFTIMDIGTPEKGRRGILQPYLGWETRREPVVPLAAREISA